MKWLVSILACLFSFNAWAADDLSQTLYISASGMKAQSDRMRVVAENIANADSTADTPDGDPYRRKIIYFKNVRDRKTGMNKVIVQKIGYDKAPFQLKYDPSHPSANQDGYVKLPNVEPIIETMDAKEAQRSYEANLSAIDVTKNMITKTIDILR